MSGVPELISPVGPSQTSPLPLLHIFILRFLRVTVSKSKWILFECSKIAVNWVNESSSAKSMFHTWFAAGKNSGFSKLYLDRRSTLYSALSRGQGPRPKHPSLPVERGSSYPLMENAGRLGVGLYFFSKFLQFPMPFSWLPCFRQPHYLARGSDTGKGERRKRGQKTESPIRQSPAVRCRPSRLLSALQRSNTRP